MMRVLVFILFAFGTSWALWYAASPHVEGMGRIALATLYMFGPLIGALAASALFDRGRRAEAIGWRWRFNLWWIVAWVTAPALALGAAYLATVAPGVEMQSIEEGARQAIIAAGQTPPAKHSDVAGSGRARNAGRDRSKRDRRIWRGSRVARLSLVFRAPSRVLESKPRCRGPVGTVARAAHHVRPQLWRRLFRISLDGDRHDDGVLRRALTFYGIAPRSDGVFHSGRDLPWHHQLDFGRHRRSSRRRRHLDHGVDRLPRFDSASCAFDGRRAAQSESNVFPENPIRISRRRSHEH